MEQSPSTKPLLVAAVNCMMLLLRGKYREIVPSVVRLDSVFVMNHFSVLQLTTIFPFGDVTMDRCSRVSKALVTLLVLEDLG